MLTEQQILEHSHIPTSEIEQDIIDTEREIKGYELTIEGAKLNYSANSKTTIYVAEGHISRRKEFINRLNQIIQYRKNTTQTN